MNVLAFVHQSCLIALQCTRIRSLSIANPHTISMYIVTGSRQRKRIKFNKFCGLAVCIAKHLSKTTTKSGGVLMGI